MERALGNKALPARPQGDEPANEVFDRQARFQFLHLGPSAGKRRPRWRVPASRGQPQRGRLGRTEKPFEVIQASAQPDEKVRHIAAFAHFLRQARAPLPRRSWTRPNSSMLTMAGCFPWNHCP
jgi:hypothetical protein